MINPKDIEALRGEFQKIDIDHSGFIEFKELENALRDSCATITRQEID